MDHPFRTAALTMMLICIAAALPAEANLWQITVGRDDDGATELLARYRVGPPGSATHDVWMRPQVLTDLCGGSSVGGTCVVVDQGHSRPYWDHAPVAEPFGSDDPVAVRFDVPGRAEFAAEGYTITDGRSAFRTLVECGHATHPQHLTAEETARMALERAEQAGLE